MKKYDRNSKSSKAIAHAARELKKLLAGQEREHKKFSSSASERWINCPGSVALSANAEKQEENKYAIEGTKAHLVFETLFIDASRATIKWLNKTFGAEMVAYCLASYHEVLALAPEGAEIFSESKAPLSHLHADAGGTLDVSIVELFGTLFIIDYKYGVKPVSPVENTQLLSYAISKAREYHYNFASVCLVIIQPRLTRKSGPVSKWECNMRTLFHWEKKFKSAIKNAEKKNAKLEVGSWCFFCPAKPVCPLHYEKTLARAATDFAD